MSLPILTHEPLIRLVVFLGIFCAVAVSEILWPRRTLTVPKMRRWIANLGIFAMSTLAVRLLFPLSAVAFAGLCQQKGWGILHHVTGAAGLKIVLGAVLLDGAIYGQHVVFHLVPTLWRLHRMHHADLDYDVTTGNRFHPIEIIMSMGVKLVVIAILGTAPLAVLIFEILLNGTAMFNHGNFRLPLAVDALLRRVIVTPDMHRVHHSTRILETNSNYGFCLSIWDRLFKTYCSQPQKGHLGMVIGLEEYRKAEDVTFGRMLRMPLDPLPSSKNFDS